MLPLLARVRRRPAAAGAGLSVALLLVGAGSAQAATQSFSSTGQSSFTVPANVTSLQVQAIGGSGGNVVNSSGSVISSGGEGRQVTATIPVTPGEVLFIEVGGNGSNGVTLAGGGGGGATDVRTCSIFAPACGGGISSLQTRLVVAGAGGGAGGSVAGGDGGDSDESGSNAVGSPNSAGDNGSISNGGQGGTAGNDGANGTLGSGGLGGQANDASSGGGNGGSNGGANGGDTDGALSGGGGAGGGYYGGGGGSGSSAGSPGGGGGAGGGASYVTPGASTSQMTWTTASPSVVLTWTPNPTPPPYIYPPLVSSVAPASGSTAGSQVVTVNGSYFAQARAVYFGAVASTSYTVTGFSTISAVVPPNVAGTVNVTVVGQGGTSAITGKDAFTYVAPTPAPAPPTPTPTPTPTPAPAPKPEICVVPNVRGESLATARRSLQASNCQVGTVAEPRAGRRLLVSRQSIPPRTRLLPGNRVDLRLSPRGR
jgi:hypothetical protein